MHEVSALSKILETQQNLHTRPQRHLLEAVKPAVLIGRTLAGATFERLKAELDADGNR